VLSVNDEGLYRHPLWGHGLSTVRWAGEVFDGEWRAAVQSVYAPDAELPLRHFIFPLKENLVEVIASDLEIQRHEGPPADGWMHRRLH